MTTSEVWDAWVVTEAARQVWTNWNSEEGLGGEVGDDESGDDEDEDEVEDVLQENHKFVCERILERYQELREAYEPFSPTAGEEEEEGEGGGGRPRSIAELRERKIEEERKEAVKDGKGAIGQALKYKVDVDLGPALWTAGLFLFFGLFGAQDLPSKVLLVLCAPMSVAIKVRGFKLLLYKAFYGAPRMPGVVASLLPGTVREVMEFEERDAMRVVYGGGVGEEEGLMGGGREEDGEEDYEEEEYEEEYEEETDEE
ncbi:hypothetical protein TrCOL_g5967 [Triparma columacea]|uniref:Uncharacterized protein n=1 Tax=Triparma columacea TaxID=722753 RepID=A0A9W7GKV3_9STRA|nr:hypothetical protein TrCOL_g5967 [Triparma columacea]